MAYMKALIRSGTAAQHGNDHVFLDMLTLVDAEGKVLYRASNPAISGDSLLKDPVVGNCIREKIPLSSTELMSIKNILRENPALSERAETQIIKTPLSADIRGDKLSEGMVMKVAYPIMDRNTNRLLGVLGGQGFCCERLVHHHLYSDFQHG
jgi:two-component system NtrC family sensor kinase